MVLALCARDALGVKHVTRDRSALAHAGRQRRLWDTEQDGRSLSLS
jgi:hypothetical protein